MHDQHALGPNDAAPDALRSTFQTLAFRTQIVYRKKGRRITLPAQSCNYRTSAILDAYSPAAQHNIQSATCVQSISCRLILVHTLYRGQGSPVDSHGIIARFPVV